MGELFGGCGKTSLAAILIQFSWLLVKNASHQYLLMREDMIFFRSFKLLRPLKGKFHALLPILL